MDGDSTVAVELLAAKQRTKLSRLPEFTALHYFVVTLRCEHSCLYCQVSRVSQDKKAFDMSQDTADRAIDCMLQSPAGVLKVEFQGGEPLLNFPLIKYVVEQTRVRAPDREFEYVVATNLALIDDAMLDYFATNGICISTSLDGPPSLHDKNRPRPGGDSYERVIHGISKVRARLGHSSVSALMTSTPESLNQPEAIVDEYVKQGFKEIFVRWISPYGFAARGTGRSYGTGAYLEFYKRALRHIIQINKNGYFLREVYASVILERILSPFPTGYVDLQSPAGIGISAMAYNYDGDVYASDEGRMLAEMNDKTFRMGNLHTDSYKALFENSQILPIIAATMNEGIPGCSDCALQTFCGSDPVFHYRAQGDAVGHRPTSEFCSRNMSIMKHLLLLLEDSRDDAQILKSWCSV
jgi:His-Xaa-Ser system radical SAM maturase HxsB